MTESQSVLSKVSSGHVWCQLVLSLKERANLLAVIVLVSETIMMGNGDIVKTIYKYMLVNDIRIKCTTQLRMSFELSVLHVTLYGQISFAC